MKLFNKKKEFVIMADNVTNFDIQKFADDHRVKRTHTTVYSCGDIIEIKFITKCSAKQILKHLEDKFKDKYDIYITKTKFVVKGA